MIIITAIRIIKLINMSDWTCFRTIVMVERIILRIIHSTDKLPAMIRKVLILGSIGQ